MMDGGMMDGIGWRAATKRGGEKSERKGKDEAVAVLPGGGAKKN